MSDLALRATGLGKTYRIRRHAVVRYRTLREDLMRLLPWRRARDERSETFWALHDVSFEVGRGEVLGIVGRNGAGKSTLLKILARITRPTTGHADIWGRVGSLLEVGTGFHAELTGRENIFLSGTILGMRRAEIQRRFDEIVAFAEVEPFLDTPVKRFSSGMYTRLGFAVAAHLDPEVLIVDEVLAVGDASFQKKSLGKMGDVARSGRTVLFVSHNLAAVESLCGRAIWLDRGGIRAEGGAQDVVQRYLALQSETPSSRAWPSAHEAPGNDTVRIRSVDARAADGRAELDMLTPVQIDVEYWNLKPGNLLNLSHHVYNELDVLVFNAVPVHEPNWMYKPMPVGLYRSSCVIPGYLLNSGSYRIDTLFVVDQGTVSYMHRGLVSFDVAESLAARGRSKWYGRFPGVTHPRTEWQTTLLSTENAAVSG